MAMILVGAVLVLREQLVLCNDRRVIAHDFRLLRHCDAPVRRREQVLQRPAAL
jgi:hypothetical protein